MIPRFRSPFTIVWEATDSCNLACIHCRTSCTKRTQVRRNEEVERALVDYAIRNRVFVVNISGGEPLLHPTLPEIVAELTQAGIQVGLSTNGLLWHRRAAPLIESGLKFVQISVDGPPDVHAQVRRSQTSYAAALSALRSARDAGLRVQMNTVLSSLTAPHIDGICELALDLGVQLHVRRYIPTGSGFLTRHLIPGPEQHLELLRTLVEIQRKGELEIEIEAPLVALVQRADERAVMGCGAGTTQVGVSMDGDIYPCIFLRESVGNILHDDMDTLWREANLLESIRDRDCPTCRSCPMADSCGGCRACSPGPFEDDPLCPKVIRLGGNSA